VIAPIVINQHLKLSQAEAIKALTVSQLLTTVVTVSFTFLFGWLSDKMGQRGPAVLIAGLLVALGLLIIETASSMNQFLVGQRFMAWAKAFILRSISHWLLPSSPIPTTPQKTLVFSISPARFPKPSHLSLRQYFWVLGLLQAAICQRSLSRVP
jgi:dipeptide/tripeptide permease